MPSRSQYGRVMKLSFDQHAGHRAALSRTSSRQAGHNGGRPMSSRGRTAARNAALSVAHRAAGAKDVVAAIGSSYARTDASSMCQSVIPKKLGPDVIRAGPRFSDKIMLHDKVAMSVLVFDRPLLRARRRRAAALGAATFLVDRVADDLAERLSAVLRHFEVAVDLGTPTDAFVRALAGSKAVGTLVRADALCPERRPPGLSVVADEEALPFRDASLDLLVSGLALQFVNDLPGTLAQVRRALKPDGLFVAALAGGDTLAELRQSFAAAEAEIEGGISPRVAPFADLRDMGALLQRAGFALPVTDVERITVRYASAFALMHDLRRMGATNALIERRRRVLRRATLMRMAEIYATRFADADGRVRATFEIVWLSGWPPHESQQKPLAPGTAQRRLADALGAREIPAGDKAEP